MKKKCENSCCASCTRIENLNLQLEQAEQKLKEYCGRTFVGGEWSRDMIAEALIDDANEIAKIFVDILSIKKELEQVQNY